MSEMVEQFWAKVDRGLATECWPWTGRTQANRSGIKYGYCNDGTRAHRLAWGLINGDIPAGLVVRHSCDNGICCNPGHLLIGTQLDNVRDRYERGRENHVRGSAHGIAKLTESDVHEIRRLLKFGWSRREVAVQFGVSQFPINEIANGRAWQHV